MSSELKELTEAAIKGLGKAAQDAINKLPGGTSEPDPSIADAGTAEEAMEAALEVLKVRLKEQGAKALSSLGKHSEKATQQGAEVLRQLSRLGLKVAEGKISAATAETVLQNLLSALDMLQLSITNKTKVEAFKAGLATLKTIKTILFSLVEVAVSIYAPSAVVWVKAIGLEDWVDFALGAD
jgi:hypothetical protein